MTTFKQSFTVFRTGHQIQAYLFSAADSCQPAADSSKARFTTTVVIHQSHLSPFFGDVLQRFERHDCRNAGVMQADAKSALIVSQSLKDIRSEGRLVGVGPEAPRLYNVQYGSDILFMLLLGI